MTVSAAAIEATEGPLRAELAQHDWPQSRESVAPATGGAKFFARMLTLAGAQPGRHSIDDVAATIWQRHLERNVWSRPLPGVVSALSRLRERGVRLAVVSNSEGTVEALLRDIGMAAFFDVIVDSWHVGFVKPDPRIFAYTLEKLDVGPADAMMIGDSLRADVGGAEAAGVRAALLDPFDLYPDAPVPRFARFPDFVDAVLAVEPPTA